MAEEEPKLTKQEILFLLDKTDCAIPLRNHRERAQWQLVMVKLSAMLKALEKEE